MDFKVLEDGNSSKKDVGNFNLTQAKKTT